MKKGLLVRSTLAVLAAALLFPAVPSAVPTAHANVAGKIRDFFQLPEEVDELKEGYAEVRRQYEDTQRKLDETQQAAERYRAEQERLAQENKRLAEQNRNLSRTVENLRAAEQIRERGYNKLKTALYTAIALIAAAFVAGRVLRVALRKRR